jgi:hypothetical protein
MNDINKPMPLSTRHAKWILEFAIEAIEKHIADAETELVRQDAMRFQSIATAPKCTRGTLGWRFRHDRIGELETMLVEYASIYDWLRDAYSKVSDKSAQEFAEELAAHMRNRKA